MPSALRSPGPPPSTPPPPTPTSSSGNLITRPLPAPRPRARVPKSGEPQWPSRPQSQDISEAAIWPVKAPPRPPLAVEPDDVPPARPRQSTTETKRSSLSLNRFSLHRPKPKVDEPLPPIPTSPMPASHVRPSRHDSSSRASSTNGSVRNRRREAKASTSGSRAVQRRASGVERRVSASVKPGSSATRSPSAPHAPSRTPILTDVRPQDPPSTVHSLQKKRSFFRRLADKLTPSKSNIREEARRRGSMHSHDMTIPDVPTAFNVESWREETQGNENARDVARREEIQMVKEPSNVKEMPNDARVFTTAKEPLNMAYIPNAEDRELSQLPTPQSMTRVSEEEHVPPSPILPPTPTAPKSARKARPPSIKVVKPVPAAQSPSHLRSNSSPRTADQPFSPTYVALPPSPAPSSLLSHPRSPKSVPLPQSPAPLPASPSSVRQPASPSPSLRQPASSTVSSRHALQTPPTSPGFPPPPATTKRTRTSTRTTHHTGTDSPAGVPLSAIPAHVEADRLPRSRRNPTSKYVEHLPESPHDDGDEHERRASEDKVSKWLAGGMPDLTIPPQALFNAQGQAYSPTTSSSLDHSSTLSHGGSRASRYASSKKFGLGDDIDEEEMGFGELNEQSVAAWRDAMHGDDDADVALPEVERMALEAEERVRMRGELPRRTEPKNADRRSVNLFGRKKADADAPSTRPRVPARPIPQQPTKRTSLGSLLSSASSPTSPTLSPTPRPRRTALSPTMHTRGSILMETKDIEDPESRRLSELVFLS